MSAVERSDAYLIVKHGLYYKPKSQGYIGIRDLAGRFSLDEVATLLPNQDSPNQDGMTFVHADDAPEFSDACWDDVKAKWLMQQRDEARAELNALRQQPAPQSDEAATLQSRLEESELDEAWKDGFNAGFGEAKLADDGTEQRLRAELAEAKAERDEARAALQARRAGE